MRYLGWATLSVSLALAARAADGGEPFQLGPIPVEGILILRNGQAVAGSLTRAGDHYFVALPQGEIRLRADDVEMACRDLDEAYARKRAVLATGDAPRHLELAGWCLRHGLLGPAASELADAMRANPNHPLIPVFRRRLEIALNPKGAEPSGMASQPVGPSREELDAMVRRLPAGTVETFTTEVQPLLMNNCTSSGCHGPNSEHELRLLRVPRNRPGGRRITQQNLHAVLQWVDREAPEKSKLLAAPIEPHGGKDRPVFTQREVGQLQQLAAWVTGLRKPAERESVPASVRRLGGPPLEAGTGPLPPEPPDGRMAERPGAVVGPAPLADPNDPFSAAPLETPVEQPGARPRVQRGATLEGFAPADPFDPEIFNRRYFRDE